MVPRPHVLLLVPHLGGGGAEKVIQLLASHLSPDRYELHLGLMASAQSSATLDSIPSHVSVHSFPRQRVRNALPDLLRLIWRVRPRVILSGMAHLNFLVLAARPLLPRSTRIIVRQNGTISAILREARHPKTLRALYRTLYPRADRVICQSDAMARDMQEIVQVSSSALAVLPNPVDEAAIRCAVTGSVSRWPTSGSNILAISRLAHEKGLDILLHAFAQMKEDLPESRLIILGKGSQEAALGELSAQLDLETSVQFAGHVADPSAYFPGASLFVLPSRHEGIPNALLEAAVAGLPIVATPASQGLVQLIGRSPGVWLAADTSPQALAGALRDALVELRTVTRYVHNWIPPFFLQNAIPAYQSILDEVLLWESK
jgi:glycosyltransferase involved in cell wall biosynthesis